MQRGRRQSGCNEPPRGSDEALLHLRESGNLESCAGVCLQGPRLSSSPLLSAIPFLWYLLAVFTNPCISIINYPKLVRWPAGHTQCVQDSSGGCLGPPHTRETSPHTGGPSWGLPPTTAALSPIACIPVCFWSFLNPCSLSCRPLLSSPEWAPATAFSVA